MGVRLVEAICGYGARPVYTLLPKPSTMTAFTWSSEDLRDDDDAKGAFEAFMGACKGQKDASCFPYSARDLPGFGNVHILDIPWLQTNNLTEADLRDETNLYPVVIITCVL